MNPKRALAILAKKFVVNVEIFKSCSKDTILNWAEQVHLGNMAEELTGINTYELSRYQHMFLIGETSSIPVDSKFAFNF